MEYEDFELQIGPLSREGLLVRVRSPAGEGEALANLRRSARDPEPVDGVARHLICGGAPGFPSSPIEVGRDLYQSVFIGPVSDLFQQSLSRVEASARGLRLRVRINPRDSTLASLLDLPWELLYREDTEDFLALSRGTPIVRALDVPRPAAFRRYQPPLRVLAVLARDPESSPLSLEEELKQLRDSLERNPEIRLEALEDPDTQTIRNALDQEAFHILHYMGHGVFEPASGDGALLFGGPEGRLPVTGRHLAAKVRDLDALQLVVLNACETAVVGGESVRGPFAGVASALVLGGIPAVVAMQSSIRDAHSLAFTSAFYQRLAGGMPVEEAVTEGRQAIHSLEPDAASWALPVLFLRATGDLFGQGQKGVPGLEVALPQSPAQKGFQGLPARALLLGLLTVALGAGLIDRLGDVSSGSRDDTESVPPATQSKAPLEKPDPVRQSLPSRQTGSPAPSANTSEIRKSSRIAPVEDCGMRLEIVGTPPAGFATALCQEAKRLAGAVSQAAGRTARIEVSSTRCSPSEEEGVSGLSCAIEALISLRGEGLSEELPSVSVESWQPNGARARSMAAEKLVPAVVARIAKSL